ncbi:helix-turn-helix domain-containing protein [Streptomyces sp. NPDC091383]|uniref:helix-turn-helix domain-containing protein n=1 Tax=Streptomyces sp. NPDC091383 TaxID=3365996 RepID=UPI0037FD7FBA
MSTRSRVQKADGTPQPARPALSAHADRVTRCTEAIRDIAEDCTVLSEDLLAGAYSGAAPNIELLQRLIGLRDLVEEAIGVVVVRQRAQAQPLKDLVPIAGLTEDRLRKKYDPAFVDRALATRRRPEPVTSIHPGAAPAGTSTLRRPGQRLAAALSLMQRGSGRRQSELAERMGVHASYVSRMLSGERFVSWPYVRVICEMCGTDPERMKPLWEAAAGVPTSNTEAPGEYLRTYLLGLHYALGSPAPEALLAAIQRIISADDITRALYGPGIPDWPVIERLTFVLQSLTSITRPLWRRAQMAAESSITS